MLPAMPSIDMPLEQMRQYRPPLYRPPDFEPFWRRTIAEATDQPLNAELIPYNLPARGLQCYAVRFDGYNYSIDQHTSYYEQNSESLHNISQVITGQTDEVQTAEERYDPWYWEVVDPEDDRDVTNPDTGAWEN